MTVIGIYVPSLWHRNRSTTGYKKGIDGLRPEKNLGTRITTLHAQEQHWPSGKLAADLGDDACGADGLVEAVCLLCNHELHLLAKLPLVAEEKVNNNTHTKVRRHGLSKAFRSSAFGISPSSSWRDLTFLHQPICAAVHAIGL